MATEFELVGLASTTRVVEGILARLGVLAISNGGYVRSLKKGAGSLERIPDAVAFQNAVREMAAQAPAVIVALDDIRGFDGNLKGNRYRAEAEILVYCISDHRTSLTEGRLDLLDRDGLDQTKDPGLRTLFEDVFKLLAGWIPPGPNSGRLEPIRGTTRAVLPDATVWEWRFINKVELGGDITLNPKPPITSANVRNEVLDRDGDVALTIEEDLP